LFPILLPTATASAASSRKFLASRDFVDSKPEPWPASLDINKLAFNFLAIFTKTSSC